MQNTTLYKVKLDSTEKDILISQLRSQILELEQNEKNYEIISKKYNRLKHE
jgi:hypothetical protein